MNDLLVAVYPKLKREADRRLNGGRHSGHRPTSVAHDALLKACRSFHQFEGDSEAQFVGWLQTIVTNDVRDKWRRRHSLRDSQRDGDNGMPAGAGEKIDDAPGPRTQAIAREG